MGTLTSSKPMYFEVGEPVAWLRQEVSWEFSIDDFVNPREKQMLPYQERVVQEKKDLDEKIGKLEAFLGEGREPLPYYEQERLVRQHRAMEKYSSILGVRIGQFSAEQD